MKGLSYRQDQMFEELVQAGPSGVVRSCTNPTMMALSRKGLAHWKIAGRHEVWSLTEKGNELAGVSGPLIDSN